LQKQVRALQDSTAAVAEQPRLSVLLCVQSNSTLSRCYPTRKVDVMQVDGCCLQLCRRTLLMTLIAFCAGPGAVVSARAVH
jgi:hypothetical protein